MHIISQCTDKLIICFLNCNINIKLKSELYVQCKQIYLIMLCEIL